MPWLAQPLDEPVGAVLGPHEHERQLALSAQLRDEGFEPVQVLDRDEAVLDVGACAALRGSAFVHGGIARVLACDHPGLAVERGGEEQRLASGGALRDDPVDRGPEAHVEHPVGLVEDEDLNRVEREGAPGEQVLEPPGGRDEHVRAGGVPRLLDEADAAVDGRDPERACVGDLPDVLDDLGRELAGGCEDERRRPRAVGLVRSTIGIPKASVLPDPVGDFASTSRPASTSAITSRWIANGCVIPCWEREPMTARETPRSAKD